MFYYLDEVDTLDDVDIDDDDDTELEVETLEKGKINYHHTANDTKVFLINCKNNNSWKI